MFKKILIFFMFAFCFYAKGAFALAPAPQVSVFEEMQRIGVDRLRDRVNQRIRQIEGILDQHERDQQGCRMFLCFYRTKVYEISPIANMINILEAMVRDLDSLLGYEQKTGGMDGALKVGFINMVFENLGRQLDHVAADRQSIIDVQGTPADLALFDEYIGLIGQAHDLLLQINEIKSFKNLIDLFLEIRPQVLSVQYKLDNNIHLWVLLGEYFLAVGTKKENKEECFDNIIREFELIYSNDVWFLKVKQNIDKFNFDKTRVSDVFLRLSLYRYWAEEHAHQIAKDIELVKQSWEKQSSDGGAISDEEASSNEEASFDEEASSDYGSDGAAQSYEDILDDKFKIIFNKHNEDDLMNWLGIFDALEFYEKVLHVIGEGNFTDKFRKREHLLEVCRKFKKGSGKLENEVLSQIEALENKSYEEIFLYHCILEKLIAYDQEDLGILSDEQERRELIEYQIRLLEMFKNLLEWMRDNKKENLGALNNRNMPKIEADRLYSAEKIIAAGIINANNA